VHITILAIGTLGDVQPYVALGLGLQAAGNKVRIATHRSFEVLVCRHGLEFAPVASDPRVNIISNTGRSWRDRHHNGLYYVIGIRKLAARIMQERVASCWQACQGTQAIITSGLGLLSGCHIAEKLNIPLIRAFLSPATPTCTYPANFVPPTIRLGSRFNLFSHYLVLQLLWLLLRPQANKARQEVLNLPPLSLHEPFGALARIRSPVVYGYSPTVVAPPKDWGDWLHVTGYWFLEQPVSWQPPAALVDFLASGPPPVHVGFGSMSNQNAQEVAQLVVNALSQVEARGILLSGWGGLSELQESDTIYSLDFAPHDWLFPQMALVIHHGGAGTVATSLCAGVPMVVVPFLPDQLFWGQRIHELGAGPQPIMRQELTVERLVETIRTTIRDPEMKLRARTLGQRIRAEDGVTRAVNVIHNYLAGHEKTHLSYPN
jgi:UDP:flavonoid glycosyltransferase YjiC (YdhE family)